MADEEKSEFVEFGGHKVEEYTFGDTGVTVSLATVGQLDPIDGFALLEGVDFTGQMVWKGGRLLASHLAAHPEVCAGKTVVELGSGTGLAGLAAVAGGTPAVTLLTDGNEKAVELLQRNADLAVAAGVGGGVSVGVLDWAGDVWAAVGDCLSANNDNCSSDGRDAETTLVSLKESGGFDVALAADVLYGLDAVDPLVHAVSELVASGGVFILAHVNRMLTKAQNIADERFNEGLTAAGFTAEVLSGEVEREIASGLIKDADGKLRHSYLTEDDADFSEVVLTYYRRA